MDVKDFMPGEDVIAGIRADIEKYEAERGKAHMAVRWRVPVFMGLLLAAIAGTAVLFNNFADPNEQWFSPPHVFLYAIGFAASFFVYGAAMKPATRFSSRFANEYCRWSSVLSRRWATGTPQRRTHSSGCRAKRPARSTGRVSTT